MGYCLRNRGSVWEVCNKDTGKVVKLHANYPDALKHLASLVINVKEKSKKNVKR
jgi:hypothetical protein